MKHLKIILTVLTLILLVGCDNRPYSSTEYREIVYSKTCINGVSYIVRSEATGYNGYGGITPYLQPNGSITLCK